MQTEHWALGMDTAEIEGDQVRGVGVCARLELGHAWKSRLRKLKDFTHDGPKDELAATFGQ